MVFSKSRTHTSRVSKSRAHTARFSKSRAHTYKQNKQNKKYKYKNKNNKLTRKQRNMRGGAVDDKLRAYLDNKDNKADKAIIVIGGYGGTISRTLLEILTKQKQQRILEEETSTNNTPTPQTQQSQIELQIELIKQEIISKYKLNELTDKIDETYDIFYFARQAHTETPNATDPFYVKCDLNSYDGLKQCVDNLKAILAKYTTKTFIINCAADKDSNIVKKNYMEGNATYSKQPPDAFDASAPINLSLDDKENDNRIYWHWTMHVAKSLADLCAIYSNLHLIHLSTVYVNKGDFLQGTTWSNDYVNYENFGSRETDNEHTKRAQTNTDGTTTTLYNIEPKAVKFNNYIYGLIKGLTEQIIKRNSRNGKFVIIRLPVIMNEALTSLDETSPSKVVKEVFDKLTSFIFGNTVDKEGKLLYTYTDDDKNKLSTPPSTPPTIDKNIHLQFDNQQQRYPLTAQYVSKYIIKKILESQLQSQPSLTNTTKPWVGIHSLCNTESITKYGIAKKFYEYMIKNQTTCDKLIGNKCPDVNNFIFPNNTANRDECLPYSEIMERDSYLNTSMPLSPENIMDSINMGFNYYFINNADKLPKEAMTY